MRFPHCPEQYGHSADGARFFPAPQACGHGTKKHDPQKNIKGEYTQMKLGIGEHLPGFI
jgi:hypothetical protein